MCQLNNVPICQIPCGIFLERSQLAHWHIITLAYYLIDTLLHYHSHEEKNIIY